MGRTCGTHEGEEKCCWGGLKERDHFEELHVGGRILLKLILIV
jgi:hypothetical protein